MVASKEGMVGVGMTRGVRVVTVVDSKARLLAFGLQQLLSCLSLLPLQEGFLLSCKAMACAFLLFCM